jgi:hypothetical protein
MERNGQHPENPQRVERRMGEAPAEDSPPSAVEREALQGSDRAVERERIDGPQADVARQGLKRGRGPGREDAMDASRPDDVESRSGDRSDPMPGDELH